MLYFQLLATVLLVFLATIFQVLASTVVAVLLTRFSHFSYLQFF